MPEEGTAPVAIDMDGWVCPMPLRDSPNIVMGHGGGGAMSGELIEHLFLPAFGSAAQADMGDSAVVTLGGARLAFSTDSFVVKPLVFPGGTIGELAVNGTVNDLAMAGARPMVLSTAFILEEGTALADIARIAQAVGTAALAAGVQLVTGDTKVVDAGHGDGIYLNTAGIGLVDPGVDIRPQRATPGDVVLVSGDIGVHGIAVLSCREGLSSAPPCSATPRRCTDWSRRCWRPAPTYTCCAIPPAAASPRRSTRSLAPRMSVWRWTSGSSRSPRACGTRAGCSGWTRCTWPTRASFSRSSPLRTRTACSRRCGSTRWVRRQRPSAGASPSIPGWWWPARPSAARAWWTCPRESSCRVSVETAA